MSHWIYEFLMAGCFDTQNLNAISESDILQKFSENRRCNVKAQKKLRKYQGIFLGLLGGYQSNLVEN